MVKLNKKWSLHKQLIPEIERRRKLSIDYTDEGSEEEEEEEEQDEWLNTKINSKSYQISENTAQSDPIDERMSRRATRLWEKYKHLFKPLETAQEKEKRISNIPITKINVDGVDIDVRIPGLGLPWYIDQENRKRLESAIDPDVISDLTLKQSHKFAHFPIQKGEYESEWMPLPGFAATYFPHIKVLDHKHKIKDYDFVTLLHDNKRNYSWTYQRSTLDRSKEFNGQQPLDTYTIEGDCILPDKKRLESDGPSPYQLYTPIDYFASDLEPEGIYPRKTLDVGIFRQPKMDTMLRLKFDKYYKQTFDKDHFGYYRPPQSFYKTIHYQDNGDDKPGMAYRELGKTGLKLSEVGLGTMFFGSSIPESDANELLDYAFDKFGLNFFDTCDLYPIPYSPSTFGESERILGRWIKRRGADFRSKIVISTKISRRSCGILSRKGIVDRVDEMLKRLGLEYIDLLQFDSGIHLERNT